MPLPSRRCPIGSGMYETALSAEATVLFDTCIVHKDGDLSKIHHNNETI